MGTYLYDSFHSFERILEGNQELRKEVLTMFGGHVEFNGCKHFSKEDENKNFINTLISISTYNILTYR